MPPRQNHRFRLVIQQLRTPEGLVYRVLAYGDRQDYGPAQFATGADLRKALDQADLSLAGQVLARLDRNTDTRIVFSGSVELSTTQLAQLGMDRPSEG